MAERREVGRAVPGDPIEVTMPYAKFTYKVERTRIVKPTDFGVIKRVGYDRLVLTACHPLYSAAKRIAVFARLERTEPRGELLRQVSAGRPQK